MTATMLPLPAPAGPTSPAGRGDKTEKGEVTRSIAWSQPIAGWSWLLILLLAPASGRSQQITFVSEPVAPRVADGSGRADEPLPPPEPEAALTLDDLEHMALAANPSIVRASALVGAAHGNWMQVGLLPNPTVGYEGQQIGSGGLAEQHGLLFSQEIVGGGKLRLNRAVAEQELDRARQELAVQQQRVLTDVRIAFYEVLVAQRRIDVTQNLVRISRLGAEAADALLVGKEATRADILQAQLEIENAQILAQNARHRHDAAWRSLTAAVGDPHLPPQALAGDAYAAPQELDFAATLEHLQSTSPELASAMSEVSRARWSLERARVEPIPNATVLGMVNVIDNGIGGQPDGTVGVSLPLPVFNRNQGAILKARHELAAAEQALQQIQLGLQNRLAPVYEQYANARHQVERYQAAILPAAQETLDLTREMYGGGEANFLALLTAQRTFSQTNLNYLDALRELRTAEAEIEGLLLRDGLSLDRR